MAIPIIIAGVAYLINANNQTKKDAHTRDIKQKIIDDEKRQWDAYRAGLDSRYSMLNHLNSLLPSMLSLDTVAVWLGLMVTSGDIPRSTGIAAGHQVIHNTFYMKVE